MRGGVVCLRLWTCSHEGTLTPSHFSESSPQDLGVVSKTLNSSAAHSVAPDLRLKDEFLADSHPQRRLSLDVLVNE